MKTTQQPKTCDNCGKGFTPVKFNQRFCSTKCRYTFNDQKRKRRAKQGAAIAQDEQKEPEILDEPVQQVMYLPEPDVEERTNEAARDTDVAEPTVFENSQLGNVRVILVDGEPWFCGKDVLAALEYSESSNSAKVFGIVPEQWVQVKPFHMNLADGRKQVRDMLCISEQGLYFFLGRSDKPKALPYQIWIAEEVVPSIRKTGSYGKHPSYEIQDPIERAKAWIAEEEKRRRLLAETQAQQILIEKQEAEIAIQEQQINELKPKGSYYDLVLSCQEAIPITVIAKDYGKSGLWMNDFLHEHGVQYKVGQTWVLYAKYQSMGYTKTETHVYDKKSGGKGAKVHTKWTQSGRLFIYSLMTADGHYPIIEQ